MYNNCPEIMESMASKLRNGKHLHDASKFNKDAPKRLGESLPDGGGKKRILGDITNRAPATKGKSDPNLVTKGKFDSKKNLKTKSENSTNLDSENINKSISLRSQSSKSSSSEESVMYITAMETNDSIMDVSSIKEEIESVADSPCRPEGVEDFDATCIEDPSSVPQYARDIFRWYREREKQFILVKYLDKQKEMTKSMRAILVDWMVEVQESFELNHETLYLAVKLVDMYLMHNFVAKSKLQLVGATAVFIAAKFDERLPPLIDDFLYICDDSYNRQEFLETEIKILKAINFDLGVPLSYRFLRRYARCARISMEMLTLARFILETSLMDYELIDVLDSKLAAAALLLALKMKDMEWTPTLDYYTEYKENELQDLVVHLNRNISVPPNKHLQTIRMKYSHE
ncbi:G2/mitotic-specific cyclin-B3-like isoform X2 [Argiope bruennichi]|uniref:G2/mitotic-specific cyclin-B3-like isoform X2 n=1 Tax=Argiope bruennichi TaxID=94029 RepID=UPI0024940F21|nr:G2/mitotic-specific cyclin-B3-like isoform X2 [Argiope bruennichi]